MVQDLNSIAQSIGNSMGEHLNSRFVNLPDFHDDLVQLFRAEKSKREKIEVAFENKQAENENLQTLCKGLDGKLSHVINSRFRKFEPPIFDV